MSLTLQCLASPDCVGSAPNAILDIRYWYRTDTCCILYVSDRPAALINFFTPRALRSFS